jgi:hypothetical protein
MAYRIVKVEIERAEGPVVLCTKHEFTTVESAQAHIMAHRSSYPAHGGYDKHDVHITWADGEQVEIRMDCANQSERSDVDNDLLIADHVRRFISFHAGLYRPPHMSPERYKAILAQMGSQEEYIDFMREHLFE